MSARPMLIDATEFPHGVRCGECHRELFDGEPYSNKLMDIGGICDATCPEVCVEHADTVLLVCRECGLSGVVAESDTENEEGT